MSKKLRNVCKQCIQVKPELGKHFCSKKCFFDYLEWRRKTKICKLFKSYQEASKYYNLDARRIRKYENIYFKIKRELSKLDHYRSCRHCKINKHTSEITRSGYCYTCSKKGISRKNQGKIISKKYKGKGNPNYLHGKSKADVWQSAKWYHVKQKLPNKCIITGIEENIDYHHIIPNWFCKIVGIDTYCPYNIAPVNHEYHKAIHHLHLDVLLLPNLYSLYKQDAPQLKEYFRKECLSHKLHQIDVEKYRPLYLFQVARYPGRKKLCSLLPEFLPPFLDQREYLLKNPQ